MLPIKEETVLVYTEEKYVLEEFCRHLISNLNIQTEFLNEKLYTVVWRTVTI